MKSLARPLRGLASRFEFSLKFEPTFLRNARICVSSPCEPRRLARKAELKYSTPAKIEGDFVKKPGVQMVAKLAKVLGVSVEEFIEIGTMKGSSTEQLNQEFDRQVENLLKKDYPTSAGVSKGTVLKHILGVPMEDLVK